MSNFKCEKCGAICYDSPLGYTTGCKHYPPEIKKEFKNMINWKMFVDKKTDLCYIKNIANEWWEWSDSYDEWQAVSCEESNHDFVEIKEFIAEEDAHGWYPPSWIEND